MAFGAIFVNSSHPTYINADIRNAALRTISDKMAGTPTGKCFLYFPVALGYRPSSGHIKNAGRDGSAGRITELTKTRKRVMPLKQYSHIHPALKARFTPFIL
jgi:hypothetical protein